MASRQKTVQLKIGGMTCANCQKRIEKRLRGKAGIHSATANYQLGMIRATITVV